MKSKRRESKFLARLSGPGLFSLRLFGWSYLILFIPQVAFDVVAYESGSWLWFPIWSLGHLLIAVCAYFLRSLWLDKRLTDKPSAALNISIAAGLGALRVTFIGYTSFELGLAPEFNLLARIIAGAILGATIFIVLGSVLSSRTDYQASLGKLLDTQRQLENLRRASREEVTTVQREWAMTTRSVIGPKLEEIAKFINVASLDVGARKEIVHDLRELLDTEIKPLSTRLKSASATLANEKTFKVVSPIRLFTLPERVNPDLALNPLLHFLVLAAAIPFALYVFEGPEWIPFGFEMVLVSSLFLYLNKLAVAKRKPISKRLGLAALCALILSQTAIGYLMLRLSGLPDQTVWAVAILLFSALVITTSLYGLVVTYEYNQAAFIKTLSRNNRRLAKELTLVNQKLWVEKREWALRLHGSVQSSLTAAVARLSGAGTPSTVQLAKVREHLSQAMKGLRAPAAKPVNLRESLKEIKRTWAGIAKINADLNSDAAKHVLVDGLGGVIANEIIKEAVSNSITHGKSDQVMIRFETPRPGFLEIIVQDNGRGISRKSRLGLGTQILDEIAFPWSIQNQPTGGTILRAQIALSPKKRRATIK